MTQPPPYCAPEDVAAMEEQLGRPLRGVRRVAHRCPCGQPDVVETEPILPDGSPFPTFYYLTCPKAASAIGRLEGAGLMKDMTARLDEEPALAERYEQANQDYLTRRDELAHIPGQPTVGGMPDRVKCLHVHAAHALVAGPEVNPFGDETLAEIGSWWEHGSCVEKRDS